MGSDHLILPPAHLTVPDLVPEGGSRRVLDREVERGALVRVRRGAYVQAADWAALDTRQQHLVLASASLRTIGDLLILSHRSAAIAHGIPFLGPVPERVEVTGPRSQKAKSTIHLAVHQTARVPAIVEVGAFAVVTPARAAIDIARTMDFASGMIAVNDVLHRRLATEDELLTEIDRLATKGAPRALDVVERADARAESPGESLSLARFHQLDVPIPELQQAVVIEFGIEDRPDFRWEDPLRFGEFDGEVKYQRDAFGSGRALEEIVRAEKVREDRLRRIATSIGRWTWQDALTVRGLAKELRRIHVLEGKPRALFGLGTPNGLW